MQDPFSPVHDGYLPLVEYPQAIAEERQRLSEISAQMVRRKKDRNDHVDALRRVVLEDTKTYPAGDVRRVVANQAVAKDERAQALIEECDRLQDDHAACEVRLGRLKGEFKVATVIHEGGRDPLYVLDVDEAEDPVS